MSIIKRNIYQQTKSMIMKSLLFLLVFVFSVSVNAQIRKGQQPYQTKSLTNESIKDVEVETSGGSIDVTGSTGDARIEVYVNRNNNRNGDSELSKEEIQQRLNDDYNLDVSVSNGKLTAKAKPKRNNMDWKRALSVSFRIFVPQNVSTDLSTSGGGIQLANLSGEQRFSTSGGGLDLDNITGKTRGSTSGGSITLKNSKNNDLRLSTSGGNIEATDCSGNLNLSTSGGSLRLTRLDGDIDASTSGGSVRGSTIAGDLKAHTSGGDVDLRDLSCSLEASTSGGHIDVAIKKPGKFIKVSNSGGNINLQLPKNIAADLDIQADRVNAGTLDNFSGTIDEDTVRGKLNGGGVNVSADAGSGRVSLTFQ
jgi:DUF4097 and DUF4098 domain-containing protein YvlB